MGNSNMKCATCRRRLPASADHCQHCGARTNAVVAAEAGALLEQRPVNAPLAAVMSFLVPGLGQIYLGQVAKGLFFLALIFIGPITGGLSHIVLAIYAAMEAFSLAKRRRAGEPITSWGTLWDPTWRPFN